MNNIRSKQNIHVFIAKYPFAVSTDYLPEARRAEIDACADADVRQAKLYAFKLLEIALSRTYSKSIRDCNFVKSTSGKWTMDFCEFSISHSNCVVTVAVSDMPVGVDVERIDRARFDDKLRRRIFTPAEEKLAQRMTEEQKRDYANKLWTVKEALFKRNNGKTFVASKLDALTSRCETIVVNDGDDNYYLSVASSADGVCEYDLTNVKILQNK